MRAQKLRHYRSPCVHCGLLMENVSTGPCLGDASKRVPMAYQPMGVRWDGVERFMVEMSDGSVEDFYSHASNHVTYFDGWLAKARQDMTISQRLRAGG